VRPRQVSSSPSESLNGHETVPCTRSRPIIVTEPDPVTLFFVSCSNDNICGRRSPLSATAERKRTELEALCMETKGWSRG
jgi:hypothetical protein